VRIQPQDRFWIGIYGFTACIMCVAIGVFTWLAHESRQEAGMGRTANAKPRPVDNIPDERYELLAAFPAPVYVPVASDPVPFSKAMQHYAHADYSGAIPKLRAINSAEARFYLGICLLLTNQRISGIEELRSVTQSGDGPYLERARFYLAKGLIAEHDAKRAQEQLEKVATGHGDLEKEARILLSQIRTNP